MLFHDTWFAVYHWMWNNGVQGNVAASFLLGVPTVVVVWRKVWKRYIRPHIDSLEMLHVKHDEVLDHLREMHTQVAALHENMAHPAVRVRKAAVPSRKAAG